MPTIDDIIENTKKISPYITETPILHWNGSTKNELVYFDTQVVFKCELFQRQVHLKLEEH